MSNLFEQASLIVTPNATKAGKLYSIKPTSGAGDLSVTRATTATRVNSAGLIESVANNIPRLDYSNGSCPSILVEPQRTNLVLRSEEFDDASWLLIGATTSADIAISPSGTTNTDELIGDGTDTSVRIRRTVLLSAGVHTFSCFLKSGTDNFAFLEFSGFLGISGTSTAFFDLANGTTPTSGASIENYGNGWYRCSISATIDLLDTSGSVGFRVVPSISTNSFPTVGDANGKSILAWGAQLEAGSNATSYIPTVASAVTRNADVISKTGISDFFNNNTGTLFLDFTSLSVPSTTLIGFSIFDTISSQSRFLFSTGIGYTISGVGSFTLGDNILNKKYKVAIVYGVGVIKLFCNGVLINSINANLPFTLNQILYNSSMTLAYDLNFITKNILTDQECINLTTL
jgi:hypothetical protein